MPINNMNERRRRIFVNNFSVNRAGYHLVSLLINGGIKNSQELLFGAGKTYLHEFFIVLNGVDLKQACFLENELRTVIEKTIKLILANPKKITQIHKRAYRFNNEYFEFARKCVSKDVTNLSNVKLAEIYKRLMNFQAKGHHTAIITTWFVDSDGEDLSRVLIEKTRELVRESGKDINFAEAFSVLTTMPKESIGMKEERESLKVLKMICDDQKTHDIFENLESYNEIPTGITTSVRDAIKQHFKKWNWMPFAYLGPAYKIDFYLKEWTELIRKKFNVYKEIKKRESWVKKTKKLRDELMQSLKLTRKDREIYNVEFFSN